MVEDWESRKLAKLLGDYGRLRKGLKDLSAEELGDSEDYVNLLRMQRQLEGLSGAQIVGLTEFYMDIVDAEDIEEHPMYENMERRYGELEAKYDRLRSRHSKLKSKLRKAMEPFASLIELLDE